MIRTTVAGFRKTFEDGTSQVNFLTSKSSFFAIVITLSPSGWRDAAKRRGRDSFVIVENLTFSIHNIQEYADIRGNKRIQHKSWGGLTLSSARGPFE